MSDEAPAREGHPNYAPMTDREIEQYLSFKKADVTAQMTYRLMKAFEEMRDLLRALDDRISEHLDPGSA